MFNYFCVSFPLTFREKDVQEHLRAVYGTLALGLMAASVGVVLHLLVDFLRDNLFFLFGSVLLMIALFKTPHTVDNERKRLGYFIAFCTLSGMFLLILGKMCYSSFSFAKIYFA